MKFIALFLSLVFFSPFGFADQHYSCPKKLALKVSTNPLPDGFEVFPSSPSYLLLSALLYAGHPKELAALKGDPIRRGAKSKRFWLKCTYKLYDGNESPLAQPYLIKKLPDAIKKCKYNKKYTSVQCS